MGKTFHIDHDTLVNAGFERSTYFDKNGHNDPFENMKIETYTKHITPEIKVEVCFGYFAEQPNGYALIDSGVELVIEGCSAPLKAENIREVLALFNRLSEILNNSSEILNSSVEPQNVEPC